MFFQAQSDAQGPPAKELTADEVDRAWVDLFAKNYEPKGDVDSSPMQTEFEARAQSYKANRRHEVLRKIDFGEYAVSA